MNSVARGKPGWNDLLRFVLELMMLASYAWLGAHLASWWGGVAFPVIAAALWGVFSVPGDPGRNPKSVVPTPGPIRLALEIALLGGGCVALWVVGQPVLALCVTALNVLHLVFAGSRTKWLLTH